jgi:hypothetical protein
MAHNRLDHPREIGSRAIARTKKLDIKTKAAAEHVLRRPNFHHILLASPFA